MSSEKTDAVVLKSKGEAAYIQVFQAIMQKKPTQIQAILKKNRLSTADMTVALAAAVELDNPAAVKILLKNGADVLESDGYGRIALHKARTAQMVKLLLKEKAREQILAKDHTGRTPIEYMRHTKRQPEAIAALTKTAPKLAKELLDKPTTDFLRIEHPHSFFKQVSYTKGFRKKSR